MAQRLRACTGFTQKPSLVPSTMPRGLLPVALVLRDRVPPVASEITACMCTPHTPSHTHILIKNKHFPSPSPFLLQEQSTL